MSNPPSIPRAPAASEKLAAAETTLADLEADVASLALEASEGKAGAEKSLASHRSKIELAERSVSELRRAVALAERLDRQSNATAAAEMRAEQLTAFRSAFAAREKAMRTVLDAAATMATAYAAYSEANLTALAVVPSGTTVPPMAVGAEGFAGSAFGPCERLILSELWRLAPERLDGIGRFSLPFARPSSEMTRLKPEAMPPAIEEIVAADNAILQSIAAQIDQLNQREIAAATAPREAA
jgi:hypothetical protein